MDPITTAIIAALTAGATSGTADTVKTAIADGYESLKAMIKNKFGKGEVAEAIDKLQANPVSSPRQAVLAEEIAKTTALTDPELLKASNDLLEFIRAHSEQHIQQIAHGIGIAQATTGSTASVSVNAANKKDDA